MYSSLSASGSFIRPRLSDSFFGGGNKVPLDEPRSDWRPSQQHQHARRPRLQHRLGTAAEYGHLPGTEHLVVGLDGAGDGVRRTFGVLMRERDARVAFERDVRVEER